MLVRFIVLVEKWLMILLFLDIIIMWLFFCREMMVLLRLLMDIYFGLGLFGVMLVRLCRFIIFSEL